MSNRLSIKEYALSFFDLGGLAIRDLTWIGGGVLIIAGPVSEAAGPFALYEWDGRTSSTIQHPRQIYQWQHGSENAGSSENPEGLCRLDRFGKPGYAMIYDHPRADRATGSVYFADWLSHEALDTLGGAKLYCAPTVVKAD